MKLRKCDVKQSINIIIFVHLEDKYKIVLQLDRYKERRLIEFYASSLRICQSTLQLIFPRKTYVPICVTYLVRVFIVFVAPIQFFVEHRHPKLLLLGLLCFEIILNLLSTLIASTETDSPIISCELNTVDDLLVCLLNQTTKELDESIGSNKDITKTR